MDNLSHSIAAWTLARAGLAPQTPYATAALIIGANMPDIDVFSQFAGGILAYLHTHRGNTHSLLGILPQAIILTVLLGLANHTIRRKHPAHPQIKPIPLFVASAIGLFSHLVLDFPNSYGIRFFLPFSNRWSYGDFIFVVDPWLFLLLAGALFLGSRHDHRTIILWAMGGFIITLTVLLLPFFSIVVKGLWLIFLGLLIALRRWTQSLPSKFYGRLGLTLAVAYYAMMFGFKQRAEKLLFSQSQSSEVIEQSVAPMPGNIFQWAAFRETEETVGFGQIDHIFVQPQLHWKQRFPKNFDDPAVRAALGTCTGQVMLEFSRYPIATSKEEGPDLRVTLHEARYLLMFYTRGRHWAKADVIVHADLTTEEPERCPLR